MTEKPFYAETVQLFAHVRDHAFEPLAALCDDDFGIVDINAEGGTLVVRNRAEWEAWFRGLFAQLSHSKPGRKSRATKPCKPPKWATASSISTSFWSRPPASAGVSLL